VKLCIDHLEITAADMPILGTGMSEDNRTGHQLQLSGQALLEDRECKLAWMCSHNQVQETWNHSHCKHPVQP
jgi:hypothetical protein